MESCIFCKIARGEISSYKVYEDELCLAFLDVNPASRGHTLVIPKEHFKDVTTCPKDILSHIFKIAQMLAQAQISQLGATGVNIITNAGTSAGQSVMHFHVHVIPRYDDDGFKLQFPPIAIEDKEFLLLADSIRKGV